MAMAKFKKRSLNQITGEATINKLPENILLEILSYLSMKDRCRSRRVCKKWNQFLQYDSFWRHVDLLEFRISLKTLWRLVRTRFSPRMSTLKLRGYNPIGGGNKGKDPLSDAVLQKIAARCPNLEVLHLKDCNTNQFSMESLPTSIVCLEMVHCMFKPRWMTEKQKYLPKMEHLNLDYSVWVNNTVMIDISVYRNLKYLSISNCNLVSNLGVKTIANNFNELEYLNIRLNDIDNDAVCHITQHLKKLRELCLAQCPRVSDEGVVLIATGLPVLNKLNISYCHQVTMGGLETLIGGNIRELIVVGLPKLSEKDKQTLKSMFAVMRFC